MRLYVFGTRGSIPSPSCEGLDGGDGFSTKMYGGNTTCYVVEGKDKSLHIVDAGSGIRVFGNRLIGSGYTGNMNLYITHTHWDHIQGFPFFKPAFRKGNFVDVYGEAKIGGDLVNAINKHSDMPGYYPSLPSTFTINGYGIKDVFKDQQNERNFPAPLSIMQGLGEFKDFIPESKIYDNGSIAVETTRINHPGGCISYKFTEGGKSLVIATDFEPDFGSLDERLIEWFRGSEFVVADGQYERDSKDNPFVKTWGHSDYVTDLDICSRAGVKNLLITHHEPMMDDKYHKSLEDKASTLGSSMGIVAGLAKEGRFYDI